MDDVQVLNQDLSRVSFFGKDGSSSNVVKHSMPRTVDGNISLIDIDQVNVSDSKEIFPNEDEVSQEIEDLNRKVHHLISLRA